MKRVASIATLMALVCFGSAFMSLAQQPPVHYWHGNTMPPGAIGSAQLQRGGPVQGFFQPVQLTAPSGASIALATEGQFEESQSGPQKVGLLIGSVYRLRVTNIPLAEGMEVFPTVEIIDRIYAPQGQALRFPIQVELAEDDLRLALAGKFVTRVIYLEDPLKALPAASDPNAQSWFEARAGDDPLAVADALGRPVAILRMGARMPDLNGPDMSFFFGCPPVMRYPVAMGSNEMQMSEPCPEPMTKAMPRMRPNSVDSPSREKASDGVMILPPPPGATSLKRSTSATKGAS